MSKVLLTCDLVDLKIIDNIPQCEKWDYLVPTLSIVDLEPSQLAAVMLSTTVFLAICYSGRGLLKLMFSSATSD